MDWTYIYLVGHICNLFSQEARDALQIQCIIFSDTPAVDMGLKQAQVFVGRDSLVADIYPMKSGKQFVNTLEDNIQRRGAMDKV